jgi:hypothetical protein
MLKTGASEDAVLDALLGIIRAHSESSTSPSVPIGSFDAVMTAWERGEDPGKESSNLPPLSSAALGGAPSPSKPAADEHDRDRRGKC